MIPALYGTHNRFNSVLVNIAQRTQVGKMHAVVRHSNVHLTQFAVFCVFDEMQGKLKQQITTL
jgi:hypothetical protein